MAACGYATTPRICCGSWANSSNLLASTYLASCQAGKGHFGGLFLLLAASIGRLLLQVPQPRRIERGLVEVVGRRLAAVNQADPWRIAWRLEVLGVVGIDVHDPVDVRHRKCARCRQAAAPQTSGSAAGSITSAAMVCRERLQIDGRIDPARPLRRARRRIVGHGIPRNEKARKWRARKNRPKAVWRKQSSTLRLSNQRDAIQILHAASFLHPMHHLSRDLKSHFSAILAK